jgi:hypothetical protein
MALAGEISHGQRYAREPVHRLNEDVASLCSHMSLRPAGTHRHKREAVETKTIVIHPPTSLVQPERAQKSWEALQSGRDLPDLWRLSGAGIMTER